MASRSSTVIISNSPIAKVLVVLTLTIAENNGKWLPFCLLNVPLAPKFDWQHFGTGPQIWLSKREILAPFYISRNSFSRKRVYQCSYGRASAYVGGQNLLTSDVIYQQEEATFEGKYYQVRGAINQPKGVQQPHIPLLIGGSGEKVTLKLVAQYGDACNVGDDPATMKQKFAVLKEHCETVGRDYASIHRTSTTFCLMADSDEQALEQLPAERKASLGKSVITALIGSPETIRQRLATYEEAGVQELLMRFVDGTNLEGIRRFAREFIA